MDFLDKWRAAQGSQRSRLAIGLAPQLARMPYHISRYDDPFLPFGRTIIETTAEYASLFVFDLASYLALGAAGAIALERTIPLVPRQIPTLLHAPFTRPEFAAVAFDSPFGVDGVTLATGHISVVSAYLRQPHKGIFVHSRSAMTSTQTENIGFYDEHSFEMGGLKATWVIDPIIYASGGENFVEVIRVAAEMYRVESLKT